MNPTNLLKQLISIPSVSGDEKKAVNFLVAHMQELGFDKAFVDDAGNAVGIRGTGEKQIVLLGHIDTVPGDIAVRVEDKKLYGRGAVDAKGPLSAFTIATAQLREKDLEGKQIIVVGAVEEEITTSKGARYAVTQYQPDFCIIGEPSGWDKITLGYKGIINFDYTLTEDTLHHSQAEGTPMKQGIAFINTLENYLAPRQTGKMFSSPFLELRSIEGFSKDSKQTMRMSLAVRIPPDFDDKALQQLIKKQQGTAKVTYTQELQAWESGKQNDLVTEFLVAIREHNTRPRFVKKGGSADMCIAGPAWQCPMVAYGPGNSALDHTPDEHIDLEEYEKSIKILAKALRSL